MSDYFVKEIRAIQYKNNKGNSNKDEVDNFIKGIVGDIYYTEERGCYLNFLRTCDKSEVINYNSLYNKDYLIYNNFNKKFSIVREQDFHYLPKEEYFSKNSKNAVKKRKK